MKSPSTTVPVRLPQHSALNKLGKSQKTIVDYGKATPITATDTVAPIIQMMRKGK